jgi:hypothetical protein
MLGRIELKIDHPKSVKLSNDEEERLRHLGAMGEIISAMISHEDRNGMAMNQWKIIKAFHFPGYDTEVLLFEMLELSYVVCNVEVGPIEARGDIVVNTLCYAWGTTFFGRDWHKGFEVATLSGNA